MTRSPLLPLSEALQRLLALGHSTDRVELPLREAAGRWAASDIGALRTQPDADLSAMDGYAIRFADMPGPWRVVGESAAGHRHDRPVNAGEAVRIFTGAALPAGTDTVLVQEEARREGEMLYLDGEGPAHLARNVRRRGLDFAQGDILVAAGERLTPARLALAAVGGHGAVPVRRRVRVAIAATGDELVTAGQPIAPGQLPESNGVMLTALIGDLPCHTIDLGILPDDRARLEEAFSGVDADILVTTGGASVGDHDLVRPALEACGGTIDFWRIALRPGKPMMAGRMRDTVLLGLPGNPVSAFVTATLFLRPLIAAMSGARGVMHRTITAPLGEDLPANGERTDYMRAARIDGGVFAAAIQDSSMLRALARADCLIVREPHDPARKKGDSLEILPIA
ncbi:gephyrin-like molybdotransferase Glp [Stakelama pacifica]|uniref:Molybdopterin molybdenumtransferase n=1 Tax=Stakelama pacifica TaxID=517720 RepID=A0A4R6FXB2_9SPHN|nr:gephyrin-like molybdotransferase Glp [Stakelama pacifica]TDN86541.1 molybdopterin molybdochelatase [Stakelama pacifica]GGO89951.1 molybdopterin molybdenumtransferase MoeA [Stakelama pacifica]